LIKDIANDMRIEEILLHLDLDDINQLFLICFSLKLFTECTWGRRHLDFGMQAMCIRSNSFFCFVWLIGVLIRLVISRLVFFVFEHENIDVYYFRNRKRMIYKLF